MSISAQKMHASSKRFSLSRIALVARWRSQSPRSPPPSSPSRSAGRLQRAGRVVGFVDEHTFLTKAGHVGVLYRIRGQDTEALDAFERVRSTLVAGLKGES